MRRMPLDAAVMFGDIMLPLAGIGVDLDMIPEAAPMALEDPSTGGNPLPMTVGDYEKLYRDAIEGKL